MTTAWQKQLPAEPLYPNILWSRPERRDARGKILIIGGHSGGFVDVQENYEGTLAAQAGYVKVVVPESLRKLLGLHPSIEFASATRTGSFSSGSANELLGYASWADVLALPGEISSNSESTVVISNLLQTSPKPIVASGEASTLLAHVFIQSQHLRAAVLTKQDVQYITRQRKLPFTLSSDPTKEQVRSVVERLQTELNVIIVLVFDGWIYIFDGQNGSETPTDSLKIPALTAFLATLLAQFPDQPLVALTTGAYLFVKQNQP